MSGISSSTGLISGIDYQALIEQLMTIERRPLEAHNLRLNNLIKEETAVTNITATFLTSSYLMTYLNKAEPFLRCDPLSSNETLLKAEKNKDGTVKEGIHTFTPVRTAMAQQTLAKGVSSRTDALGKSGTITIGDAWSFDQNVSLQDINGGEGFSKGYIRITDGSGTRATIDLRQCLTIEDVLDTINSTNTIDVWAELDGDSIKLVDQSGGTGNIKVQEVSNGKTAASLGLAGLDGADSVTGSSLYRLDEDMSLNMLNDGNGFAFDTSGPELTFRCKDGKTFNVDFYANTTDAAGKSTVHREQTLGDVIDTINNAAGNDGRIVASVGGADGKSLVLTDTSNAYVIADKIPDAAEGDPQYALPSGYDDATEYTIDENGYVVYAEGNTLGKTAGDFVYDDGATTELWQYNQTRATSTPILRSLGFTDGAWSSSDKLTFQGSLESRALIGSLDSPLMASMNGGYGLSGASEGQIEIQDRAGNKAVLSFTQAELDTMQSGSLKQAMNLMNEKMADAQWKDKDDNDISYGGNVGVQLEYNDSKTGLKVVDKSGGSSHNLVFRDLAVETPVLDENGDPVLDEENNPVTESSHSNIAGSFGLNVDATKSSAEGSNLHMQTVSTNTKLSDMRGGKGITTTGGQIQISDSNGKSTIVRIDSNIHQTLGDVVDAINAERNNSGVLVYARINQNGDGIEIMDVAGGDLDFSIRDGSASSKICAELGIAGTVTQEDKTANGGSMSIVGSTTYSIEVEETDSLDDIQKKINDAGGNFSASIIVDGTGNPYRLSITGGTTGVAGGMNIDLSCLGLTAENMTEACDAVLVYGDGNSSSGVVLTSSSNTFKNVVDGVDLTIMGVSNSPITITCERSNVDVKAALSTFVTNYNSFRELLNDASFYSVIDEKGNPLHNSALARSFDRDVTDALLAQVYNVPGINSIQSLGIKIRSSVNDEMINKATGKLEFDEEVFEAAWENNPDAVMAFFYSPIEMVDPSGKLDEDGNPAMITVNQGWAQQFVDVADRLTATETGKSAVALSTLDTKITQAQERADYMEARLKVKQAQLEKKFVAMETSLAKMSADMSTVSSIASNWSANLNNTGSYY